MGQATTTIAATALEALLAGETLKCMLLAGNSTGWQTKATREAMDFVNEISADEPSGWTGYSRPTVVSISVTTNKADGRAELYVADIDFGGTLDSSGAPVDGVAFYIEGTGDADSALMGAIDVTGEPAADRTPEGTGFVVKIGATGLLHLRSSTPAS